MTADRKTLQALLERVKEAKGADSRVDGELAKALGDMDPGAQWMEKNVYGEHSHTWYTGGYGNYTFHEPPAYTASIDAALALVERVLPGWTAWELYTHAAKARFTFTLSRLRQDDDSQEDHATGHGQSAPLAIIGAVLDALLAQTEEVAA